MPHNPTPDYYPAGILCPGGHCEGSAKPHWCWVSDYSPFGSNLSEYQWVAQGMGYRYGFQAQESDNELFGDGNASFFKYRISDNRLGRFFAVDPLAPEYPWNSPYAFSENRVIDGVELEGLERISINEKNKDLAGVSLLKIYASGKGKNVLDAMTKGDYMLRRFDFTISKVFYTGNVNYNHTTKNISYTEWSLLAYYKEKVTFPTHVILGHELYHGFQDLRGKNITNTEKYKLEMEACEFENYLRSVYDISLRETYTSGEKKWKTPTKDVNPENEKVFDFRVSGSLSESGYIIASWEKSKNNNESYREWAILRIDSKGELKFQHFKSKDDLYETFQKDVKE